MSDTLLAAVLLGGFGLLQVFLAWRLNQVHGLVNSARTQMLAEIADLKDQLATANATIGRHDA
jgi:hypothetical protein